MLEDSETVLRRIYEPLHVKNGQITSQAFELKKGDCDLSLHREIVRSIEQIFSMGRRDSVRSQGRRNFIGCASAMVRSIHDVKHEKHAYLCLYPVTATPSNRDRSHASLWMPSRSIRHRKKLKDIFNQFLADNLP